MVSLINQNDIDAQWKDFLAQVEQLEQGPELTEEEIQAQECLPLEEVK